MQTRKDLKAAGLTEQQINALYANDHGDSAALFSVIKETKEAYGETLTPENAELVLAAIIANENEQFFGMSASNDNTGKPSNIRLVMGIMKTNAAGIIAGMEDLGYDAYYTAEFMTDMAYGSIYQLTGAEVFKPNFDRYLEKEGKLVQAGSYIVNNYEDIPANIVTQYNETMAQYWALKAQGKHIEAGRLIGPACKDIALAAVGVAGGVKKGANLFQEWAQKSAIPSNGKTLGLPQNLWSKAPTDRGSIIEGYLAATDYKEWFNVGQLNNGKFPLVDFQKGNNLVSLKTVDTTGKTWISRMQDHITDLGSRGATVDGLKANMILDLRVQPGGLNAARSLIQFGQKNNVTVVVKEIQ